MSNTLLPCPFCGGTPILELFNDGFFDYARIRCCRVMFDWCGDETGEKAIAAWNRRADHLPDATKMVSNADRIRSTSDEELHKFLLDFEAGDIDYAKTFCDLCCKDAALERKSTDCKGCLLWWLTNDAKQPQGLDYWLKQPVKEEHHEDD